MRIKDILLEGKTDGVKHVKPTRRKQEIITKELDIQFFNGIPPEYKKSTPKVDFASNNGQEILDQPFQVQHNIIRHKSLQVLVEAGVQQHEVQKFMQSVEAVSSALGAKGVAWVMNCVLVLKPCQAGAGGEYHALFDTVRIAPYLNGDTTTLAGCIVHEFGHRFHFQCKNYPMFDAEIQQMYQTCMQSYPKAFYRPYSKTNHLEFWADSFHLWVADQNQFPQYQWVEQMINKYNR